MVAVGGNQGINVTRRKVLPFPGTAPSFSCLVPTRFSPHADPISLLSAVPSLNLFEHCLSTPSRLINSRSFADVQYSVCGSLPEGRDLSAE